MGKNYWMFVETFENFEITKNLGFSVHGMGAHYRRRAQRMQPDDRVLFYVSGLRKWVASATITSHYYEDYTPVWKAHRPEERHPFRVKISPSIVLDEQDYIDALILAPRLEYLKRWAPEDWPLAFFDSLHLLPQRDFRLIEDEMKRIMNRHRRRRYFEHPAKETEAEESSAQNEESKPHFERFPNESEIVETNIEEDEPPSDFDDYDPATDDSSAGSGSR